MRALWNKNFFHEKQFFEDFMKWGLRGGISIDADSGPPRYVHTLMLWRNLSLARHFYSDWLWPYCGCAKGFQYDHFVIWQEWSRVRVFLYLGYLINEWMNVNLFLSLHFRYTYVLSSSADKHHFTYVKNTFAALHSDYETKSLTKVITEYERCRQSNN